MQFHDAPLALRRTPRSSRRAWLAVGLIATLASGGGEAIAQDKSAEGAHVFMHSHCFACHGEFGFGGVGPAFRGDRFLAVSDYVLSQILLGRGIMPPFADALNDQQVAAVATYIRDSWGNRFGEIKPDEVTRARKQLLAGEATTGSSVPPPYGATPDSRK